MYIGEYLRLYEKYRKAYHNIVRARQGVENAKNDEQFSGIYSFINTEGFDRELERRGRILCRASVKLETAISRIGNSEYANYLMCRYFYGMKNTEIGKMFSYCERHVYRISSSAKERLYEELKKLMPNPRRTLKPKRYKCTSEQLLKYDSKYRKAI
jgi:hypothetical protein